jgi:hypothetical protein
MSNQKMVIHTPADKNRLLDFIRVMSLDKPWQFTWGLYKRNRSLEQNKLYWKWIGEICVTRGWGKNVVHEALRDNFISPRFEEGPNGLQEYRPSTKDLNTAEMSEYLEKVSAFAATEFGVFVTHPEDAHMR